MTKFNVGDKVQFTENYMDHKIGDVVEVIGFWSAGIEFVGKHGKGSAYYKRFKLAETKPTKNQRITALEETVAKQSEELSELKLIVHELRGKKSIEPSTMEDIIEFEGKQYRKVDRVAQEGDVIIVKRTSAPEWVTVGKPYKPFKNGSPDFKDDLNETVCVYDGFRTKHSKEDVEVYEIIKSKPLTPNQQRAEIIEKAKKFVKEALKRNYKNTQGFAPSIWLVSENGTFAITDKVEFVVNEEKRTVVALIKLIGNCKVRRKGIAKCNPSDVFNEHIGKAISLGRALGLDVSEFEQAVQPKEFTVGQKVFYKSEHGESFSGIRTISGFNSANLPLSEERGGYMDHRKLTILNDTKAKYEEGQ